MARAGLLDYVMFEKESSFATEPSNLTKSLPVDAFNLDGENQGREVRPIAGTRELLRHPTGNYIVTGSISAPFYPNEIGWLLYGLFGSVSSAAEGSSGYKHTFSISNSLPTFTFGVDRQGTKYTYLGVAVNSATLNFSREDNEVKASFDLIGQKDKEASASFGTFTYPAADVLPLSNTTFKINDVENTTMKNITLTLSNNMTPDDWRTLSSGRFITNPYPMAWSVTGSFSGLFDANVIKYKWGDASATEPQISVGQFPIELTVTGPEIESGVNYKLHVLIPKAKVRTASAPLTTDVVIVSGDFTAIYDSDSAYSILLELTNTTASYS